MGSPLAWPELPTGDAGNVPRRLAFVSDTQGTSRWELGLEDNRAARAQLIAALVRAQPDLVLHGGDLVTWGSSGRSWAAFDALFEPLRRAGVPLWPVYGNHDRMPLRRAAERHMEARFPWLSPAPFTGRRMGPLAVALLDSNRRRLGAARWEAQRARFRAWLAAWEADPGVRGVLAVWHHPPYTNSRLVRPSRLAREGLLGPVLGASKGLAVFCGHAHAYERFHVAGREIFVAGGGGGPRQPLRDARARAFVPTRFGGRRGGPSRSFLHFLTMDLMPPRGTAHSAQGEAGGLLVRVHRLREPAEGCDVAEEVWLPFGPRPPQAGAPPTPDPPAGGAPAAPPPSPLGAQNR